MTEPMRELGMINLIVTARLPGTDGTSKGSSLILRTINPNAWCNKTCQLPSEKRIIKTYFGHGIQWPTDVQNPFRISRDALGDHDSSTRFLSNLVDVRASLPNDDRRILSDDQTAEVYLLGGDRWGSRLGALNRRRQRILAGRLCGLGFRVGIIHLGINRG